MQLCVFFFVYVSLQLSGFKKVLNYTKKVMEDVRYRKTFSREEVIFAVYYFSEFRILFIVTELAL